jgi:hypothetical protein
MAASNPGNGPVGTKTLALVARYPRLFSTKKPLNLRLFFRCFLAPQQRLAHEPTSQENNNESTTHIRYIHVGVRDCLGIRFRDRLRR